VSEYDGRQFVGIDLHRRRTVIVRQSETGEHLATKRIVNDPLALAREIGKAGESREVVLEATYRRVKNDVRDAADLADLLRMGRLPEAWIAPPAAGSCTSWSATGPNW
jgi:hypothetical protein